MSIQSFTNTLSKAYGNDLSITRALKAEIKDPQANIIYDGRHWVVASKKISSKNIKLACIERIAHTLKLVFSSKYRKKFEFACEKLFKAMQLFKTKDSTHKANRLMMALEQKTIACEEKLESIEAQRISLQHEIKANKKELAAKQIKKDEFFKASETANPEDILTSIKKETVLVEKSLSKAELLARDAAEFRLERKFDELKKLLKQEKELTERLKNKSSGVKGAIRNAFSQNLDLESSLKEIQRQIKLAQENIRKQSDLKAKLDRKLPENLRDLSTQDLVNYLNPAKRGVTIQTIALSQNPEYTALTEEIKKLEKEIAKKKVNLIESNEELVKARAELANIRNLPSELAKKIKQKKEVAQNASV